MYQVWNVFFRNTRGRRIELQANLEWSNFTCFYQPDTKKEVRGFCQSGVGWGLYPFPPEYLPAGEPESVTGKGMRKCQLDDFKVKGWQSICTCNTTTCSRSNCPACCSWTSSTTKGLARRLHVISLKIYCHLKNLTLEATVLAAPPSPLVRTMLSGKGSYDPIFQEQIDIRGKFRSSEHFSRK